jgi:hypothetical protein
MRQGGFGNKGSLMVRMKIPQTRRKRTWYGLMAKVTLGPGFQHRAGFGKMILPHPPLANWLLRSGLPDETHRRLGFAHEFAHFQTAPVVLLYLGGLLTAFVLKDRGGMLSFLLVLAGGHAAWEMLSEGLVFLSAPPNYRHAYEGTTRLPRILFWLAGAALTAMGWIAAMYPYFWTG